MTRNALLVVAMIVAAGCTAHHDVKVQPVEVKPIKVTVDVNIKVDRQLDQFFEFENGREEGDPGGDTNSKDQRPDEDEGETP